MRAEAPFWLVPAWPPVFPADPVPAMLPGTMGRPDGDQPVSTPSVLLIGASDSSWIFSSPDSADYMASRLRRDEFAPLP